MSNTFKTIAFDANSTKEVGAGVNYVNKVGLFKVELVDIFGYEPKGKTFTKIEFTFKIDGTDDVLKIEEFYTSKNRDTKEIEDSKGKFLTQALVGFASGKDKASATWTPVVKKMYGEDVKGYTIKSLIGKTFYIFNDVTRSLNNDGTKAYENNSINTLFSSDKLTLKEYREALLAMKEESISSLGEHEPTRYTKMIDKKLAYKYKQCDAESWEEIRSMQDGGNSSSAPTKDNNNLPSNEELPNIVEEELPSIEGEDNNDLGGLPAL